MILSGNKNQFPSSLTPLGDLPKAFMFLSNLNSFNSSPSLPDQGFIKRKGSSKVWKEKCSKWFSHFFFSLPFLILSMHYLCVFVFLFWVSPVLYFVLFNMFLFVYFQFINKKIKKKKEKLEKYKNNVCFVYIGIYVRWMVIEKTFSKLCVFCSLDERLYAQLNKWALWLVFVMSKIK